MKKLLVLLCLLTAGVMQAQAPQFLNYQGIARDASGTIITTPIGIKFEIIKGSTTGTVVYDETNTITPSSAGVFTAAIGSGAPGTGTFSAINWASGPYFISVSIDPAGGTSYSTVGISELLSVPYALYAEKAGNSQTFTAGTGININSGIITNSSPNQTVNISGPGVLGSYPSYTVTSPAIPTASTGISISGGTITNTAPDQTVTLTAAGISSVTGTYPTFTIGAPPPALNYNSSTNLLTLTQGTAVTTTTLVGAGSSTVSMYGSGIATVTPIGPGSNFTVSVQTPTLTGAGSTTVSGTYPNYTIFTPTMAVTPPPNIQINAPHTTTTLSPSNYSITIQPTNLTGVGVASVSGTYPNYSVTVPAPSISSTGNTITISQGTAVTTTTIGGGPWAVSSGVLYPAANPTNDKVTIGSNFGNSRLDVQNGAASTLSVSPVASIINSNTFFTASGVLEVKNNAGSGAAIYAEQNGNVNEGISVKTNGVSNSGNALQSRHFGIGNAGYFEVNNNTSNGKAIEAVTNGTGIVISAVNSNSLNSSNVLSVNTNGSGSAGFFNKTGTGFGISVNHGGSSGNAGFFNVTNPSNPAQGLSVQTAGNGDAIAGYNTGNGRALYASGSSSVEAALIGNSGTGRALQVSNSSTSEAAYLLNTGNAPALFAYNTGTVEAVNINSAGNARGLIVQNNSGASETVLLNNSGNGRGLVVQNPSLSPNKAAQIVGGIDIIGKTAGTSSFAVVVTNSAIQNLFNVRDDGNVGIGYPSPAYRLAVTQTANALSVIYANNGYNSSSVSGVNGVTGITMNTHSLSAGLSGQTTVGNSAGVMGESTAGGPSIFGIKNAAGNAGKFENFATGNASDVLVVSTNGTGASIHTKNINSAGSNNLGVVVEDGHIGSMSAAIPTIGGTVCTACTTASLQVQSNDIAGTFAYNMSASYGANYAYTITFNKPYRKKPIVTISPSSQVASFGNYFITIVGTPGNYTGFTVTWPSGVSGGPGIAAYNYIVIESSN